MKLEQEGIQFLRMDHDPEHMRELSYFAHIILVNGNMRFSIKNKFASEEAFKKIYVPLLKPEILQEAK